MKNKDEGRKMTTGHEEQTAPIFSSFSLHPSSFPFDHIVGNECAKQYLVRMVENNAVANALLFSNSSSSENNLFAEAFAKILVGTDADSHPDIYHYHPEGKVGMHSIDAMRSFCEEVFLPPYQAPKKVFIIHEADRMLTYSANALLKTIEEPTAKSIIILLTSHLDSILPTLRSRCRIIRFHCGHTIEQDKSPLREKVLNLLSKGPISTYTQLMEAARSISDDVEKMRQQAEDTTRSDQRASYPEGMTSVQQQALEKELDGALAMRLFQETDALFDTILSWYRDMHLLNVGGSSTLLMHPDYKEQCEQAVQRGEILPLEHVQKAIAQAKLGFERFTSLNNCLETLFLQLSTR